MTTTTLPERETARATTAELLPGDARRAARPEPAGKAGPAGRCGDRCSGHSTRSSTRSSRTRTDLGMTMSRSGSPRSMSHPTGARRRWRRRAHRGAPRRLARTTPTSSLASPPWASRASPAGYASGSRRSASTIFSPGPPHRDRPRPGEAHLDAARPGQVTPAAAARLRRAGLRATRARVTVLDTLASLGGHRTADELAAALAGARVPIPRASLYHVLGTLSSAGLLVVADAGPGVTRYEVAGTWHHHFVCRRCRAIIDVPCASSERPCLEPDLAGAMDRGRGAGDLPGTVPKCAID